MTIACDVALRPKQAIDAYKLRHVSKHDSFIFYICLNQMIFYFMLLTDGWNMKSNIYGPCNVPPRASSTRKRRSNVDDTEIIKLRKKVIIRNWWYHLDSKSLCYFQLNFTISKYSFRIIFEFQLVHRQLQLLLEANWSKRLNTLLYYIIVRDRI